MRAQRQDALFECEVATVEAPVAIITGGGSGIGAATATTLADMGFIVHVVGRRAGPLRAVVSAIEAAGGQAEAHVGDVRQSEQLESLAADVARRHGRIDVLVANAGVNDPSPISVGDPRRWQALVDTNVLGVVFACHSVLPHMLKRRAGRLIIVSSVSGRVTYGGETVYVATKHAAVAFGESLRKEVATKGIQVALVEPGMVDTPMLGNPFEVEPDRRVKPLDPSDVARAIRFVIEQPPGCSVNEVVLRPTAQVV